MKCPKCGKDIPEGKLLCENCGAEINIVPDFEIDIEDSIDESISSIVKDINSKKINKIDDNEEAFFKENNIKSFMKPKFMILSAIFSIFIIFLIYTLIIGVIRYSSDDYHINKAKVALDRKQYDKSLYEIDEALRIDNNCFEAYLLKSDVLFAQGNIDSATDNLENININRKLNESEKHQIEDKIIGYYISANDYNKINEYIGSINDDEIKEKYLIYLSSMPEISLPTGKYSKNIEVELSSEGEGSIYYTLDGSLPSKNNGYLYTKSLTFESGEYNVKAIFINNFGIESNVVSCYYLVDTVPPEAPLVEPDSGDFVKPFSISVKADDNCEIYYTIDGTTPDPLTSLKYDGEIEVPFGRYNYCFVSLSETGLMSDVVRRSYRVELKTKVTSQMAQYMIIDTMIKKGYIKDANGTSIKNDGFYTFVYDSIIKVGQSGYYYRFNEIFTDNNGVSKETGLLYAVDAYKCVPFRLTVDSSSNWGLIPLNI